MFPRLERFLAVLAVAAIAATAAFWAFPPGPRLPAPNPGAVASRPVPVEPTAAEVAPVFAPPPQDAPTFPARSETPVEPPPAKPGEAGRDLPALISRSLREALPDTPLSDEQVRELTESVQAFRESMQALRDTERTPENAERIREWMERVEENRRRFEKTAGVSINEFLRRTTRDGIDNDRHEENGTVAEPLDRPGR